MALPARGPSIRRRLALGVLAGSALVLLASCLGRPGGQPPVNSSSSPRPPAVAGSAAAPAATVEPDRTAALAPRDAPVAIAALPPAPAREAASRSRALTPEGYKRDFARRIHDANSKHLFEGKPPPILKAVIVLRITVDARGTPVGFVVLRSNGFKQLETLAMQSVRNAAPLPAPNFFVRRGGNAEVVETWLFRKDHRFQIRTLAEVQAGEEAL